jgi:hypothetical protein
MPRKNPNPARKKAAMRRKEAANKPKARYVAEIAHYSYVAEIAHYSPGPAAAFVLGGLLLRSRAEKEGGE